MRSTLGRVAALAAASLGVAGLSAAQTGQPGYVRDGKVWFEVVDGKTRSRVIDFDFFGTQRGRDSARAAAAPLDGESVHDCLRFGGSWLSANNVGVQAGSFKKGAAGPGTFTFDTCALPRDAGWRAEFEGDSSGRGVKMVVTRAAPDESAVPAQAPGVHDELQALEQIVLAMGSKQRMKELGDPKLWRAAPEEGPQQGNRRAHEKSYSPRVLIGGGFSDRSRKPTATDSSEKRTLTFNGQQVAQEPGETSADDLNRIFDMHFEELGWALEMYARLPLPWVDFDTILRAYFCRPEAKLVYDVRQPTPGARDTEWTGTGNMLGLGLDQRIHLGAGRYLELGARYDRLFETDATRSPGLSAGGGRIVEDRGVLERDSASLHLVLRGEWGSRVAAWAGAEAAWDQIELRGSASAEFAQSGGVLGQRVEFVNKFKSNAVGAFGGLELRLAGPIHARVQFAKSSSGSTVSAAIGAGTRR